MMMMIYHHLLRKEWEAPPEYSSKEEFDLFQKNLEKERIKLAKERTKLSQLLGKLSKSGESNIKSGPYKGYTYSELLV